MKIHWDNKLDLEANLRGHIPKLAQKYFDAGRRVVRAQSHWKDLHKFRLATKRFRYTLELFEPFYGRPLRAHLAQLKKVQDYLGEANDYMTTREMLKDLDGMEELRHNLQEDAGARIADLRKFWRENFDEKTVTRKWLDYFASEKYSGPVTGAPARRSQRRP